jgi:putative alpha-1,2-mannosidase
MTGTSSNAAFSDAYTSGVVTDINTVLNIYNAGIKDAMVYSSTPATGRKGIEQSLYYGYTPSQIDDVTFEESVSWTLEGYINDYALGQMAVKLSNDTSLDDATAITVTGSNKAQIRDIGNYLLRRAENFALIFDPETKFFRAKNTTGQFVNQGFEEFNPEH